MIGKSSLEFMLSQVNFKYKCVHKDWEPAFYIDGRIFHEEPFIMYENCCCVIAYVPSGKKYIDVLYSGSSLGCYIYLQGLLKGLSF